MLRSALLLTILLKKWKLRPVKLICKRTHVCGASLDRRRSSNLLVIGQKQCEQLRILNVSQMTNSMHNSMRASAVHAVCGLGPVLCFVANHAHQYIHVSISWSSPYISSVNLAIIVRKVTSRKNNDVQLQNSNLKFSVMSILYT